MMLSQRGIGLIEVLVSLVILAIAILGFAALQIRALNAIQEANDRTAAMILARNLAEQIRVNRTQLNEYKKQLNANNTTAKNCMKADTASETAPAITAMCSRTEMAAFDVAQVLKTAKKQDMKMLMQNCQGGDRQCLYITWGDTTITSTDLSKCMEDGVYVAGAKCLVMEAYGL